MSEKIEINDRLDYTTILRLPKNLNRLLRLISMNEEISKSEWIRQAIHEKLDRIQQQ